MKKNILLIVCSLIVALLAAELVVRILVPAEIVDDPILGHRIGKKATYDANGFRNDAIPKGDVDLVALGDSQTEGNNAPTPKEAWPQQYGALAGVSVYQMAVGGYSPVQYSVLIDKALAMHPKTVAVGLYFGNDLLEVHRIVYGNEYWKHLRRADFVSEEWVEGADEFRTILQTGLSPDSFEYKVYKIRTWIRGHVKLYALTGNATRQLRERLGLAETKKEKIEQIADFAKENESVVYNSELPGRESILSPSYRLDTVSLGYANAAEGWRISQELLREIKAKTEAVGARFVLLVIPTKERVYLEAEVPPVFEEYLRAENELAEATKTFCAEEKMTCIFALEEMGKALTGGTQIYGKTMDGHPIPAGYAAIARAVYAALQ